MICIFSYYNCILIILYILKFVYFLHYFIELFFKLSNEYCKLDKFTGIWSIELPQEFRNSIHPNKRINVLSFMYYPRFDPPTQGMNLNLEYTSFHSPTLCDGNFNQDNYICTLCYTYNTVLKTYPIKSHPQELKFYFKNADGDVIKTFFVSSAKFCTKLLEKFE